MLLSVVVPAHNVAAYIGPALDSLFAELPADSEVIVVDDGSTDGTARVIDGYRDRVAAIHHPSASGPGPARNRGAARATGKYLAFHDADDLVLPGRFSAELELLEADPSIDLVFGNGIKIDPVGRPLGPVIPVRHVRRLRRRTGVAELLRGSFVYPQALTMRRERFVALGGFIDKPVEDWEFSLKAALSCRLRFLDRPVFAYRRQEGSVSMREREYAESMLDMLETFVADHAEVKRIAGTRAVRQAVARRLARCARHRARAGDADSARDALLRAIELAPGSLRYRWRYLTTARLGRRRASCAPGTT